MEMARAAFASRHAADAWFIDAAPNFEAFAEMVRKDCIPGPTEQGVTQMITLSDWQPARQSPKLSGWYHAQFVKDTTIYWRYFDAPKARWYFKPGFSLVPLECPKGHPGIACEHTTLFGLRKQPGEMWRGKL